MALSLGRFPPIIVAWILNKMKNKFVGAILLSVAFLSGGWFMSGTQKEMVPGVVYTHKVDGGRVVALKIDKNGAFLFFCGSDKGEALLQISSGEDGIAAAFWPNLDDDEFSFMMGSKGLCNVIYSRREGGGVVSVIDKNGDLIPDVRFQTFGDDRLPIKERVKVVFEEENDSSKKK